MTFSLWIVNNRRISYSMHARVDILVKYKKKFVYLPQNGKEVEVRQNH